MRMILKGLSRQGSMLKVSIQVDQKQLLKALEKAPEKTTKKIKQALNKIGVKIRTTARSEHLYKHDSHNLERSTQLELHENSLGVDVGFDENIANYGQFQHNRDPFIDKAYYKHDDIIQSTIEQAVLEAFTEAGF